MIKGLLLIDKPDGITSFGAVSKIKKLTGEKRVGHTGTLDPMATGVLPVFIGRATVLSSFLLDADKTYIATFRFGISTDTSDITGEILEENPVNLKPYQIKQALSKFIGTLQQVPPMFSAIKKNGVPLYKLARRGETAKIEPRTITVYGMKILKPLENNEITVEISCSKGTYIRSLCRDIGEYLGCKAALSALRRTATSGFDVSQCVRLEDLTQENLQDYILNEETAVMHLRPVLVTRPQAVRFSNGGKLDIDRLNFSPSEDGENVRIKYNGLLIGIGAVDIAGNQIAIKCIINGSDKID